MSSLRQHDYTHEEQRRGDWGLTLCAILAGIIGVLLLACAFGGCN